MNSTGGRLNRLRRLICILAGATLALAIAVIWVSPPVRQYRAVQAIRSGYGAPSIGFDGSGTPRWLRPLLPWEAVAEIHHVNCCQNWSKKLHKKMHPSGAPPMPPFDDAWLERILPHLRRLPDLERVTLSHTAITDEGVSGLDTLKTVRALDLSDTRLTDASIATLIAMPSLEQLDVSNTAISDPGIETIRRKRPRIDIREFDYSEGVAPRLP